VHVIQNSNVGNVRWSPLNQHICLAVEPTGPIQIIRKPTLLGTAWASSVFLSSSQVVSLAFVLISYSNLFIGILCLTVSVLWDILGIHNVSGVGSLASSGDWLSYWLICYHFLLLLVTVVGIKPGSLHRSVQAIFFFSWIIFFEIKNCQLAAYCIVMYMFTKAMFINIL
jgi:hypothetical protein